MRPPLLAAAQQKPPLLVPTSLRHPFPFLLPLRLRRGRTPRRRTPAQRLSDCARPPPAATPAAAPNAGADFAAVRRAYEVLSNESLRREYDAARAAAARSRRVAVSESLDLDAMAATQLPSGEYEFTRACRCGGRYVLTEQELEAIVAEAEGDAKAKQGGTVTAAVVNVQCDMCSLVVSVSFSVA